MWIKLIQNTKTFRETKAGSNRSKFSCHDMFEIFFKDLSLNFAIFFQQKKLPCFLLVVALLTSLCFSSSITEGSLEGHFSLIPFFQFLTNFRGCQDARAAFSSLLHWLTACLVGCHLLVVDFCLRMENSFQAMALLRSTGFTWCVRMRDLPQLSQLLVLRRSVGWNKGSIFALLLGGLSLLNRDIFIKDLTPK